MRIGRLIKGSLLERSGHVHEGDEILEVNGIDMHDKHIDDAARLIVRFRSLALLLSPPTRLACAESIALHLLLPLPIE